MRPAPRSLISIFRPPETTSAVRARLVERLYGMEPGVFVSSLLAVVLFGIVLFHRTDDMVYPVAAIFVGGSVLFLLVTTRYFTLHVRRITPGEAALWERRYCVFSLIIAGGVSVMACRAFLTAADAVTLLLVETLCLGTVASITRNYFSLPTVLLQLVLLLLLPAVSMLALGDFAYAIIAFGSVALLVNMAQISFGLHCELVESFDKDATLETQHNRFDAALDNMEQGLCMYDADEHLVVFNQRYLDMHGFAAEDIHPGMHLKELLRHSIAIGNHSGVADLQETYRWISTELRERRAGSFQHQLSDGRTIEVFHRPITGGGWVTTHSDITDRKLRDERIAYLARHDELTGLFNRGAFQDCLAEQLDRLGDGELAVLAVDLDRFKPVNDTLGHPVGDAAMKVLALRLRECVGDEGIAARIGGDEFAIIHPGGKKAVGAAALAERIIETMSQPMTVNGHQIVLGASAGIAAAPRDGRTIDELMRHADLALYRAKEQGFGCHVEFSPDMDGAMRSRRAMELDLRKALRDGEFSLVYQPFIDMPDGRIAGFEALVRWNHPERGLIGPDEFIGLAEEMGVIGALGEWVLREACNEAATWPEDVSVAVNISPAQFRHGNLPQLLIQVLAASGLDPARLELEITEGVLLQNEEGARRVLDRIRTIGARVAMDDFGTGYSSLSYLRSFPFDKIKIDRLFMRDIDTSDEAVAIARAIVTLGDSLGRTVLAEGIENEEQFRIVAEMGYGQAQGFHIGRPVDPAQATRMAGGGLSLRAAG